LGEFGWIYVKFGQKEAKSGQSDLIWAKSRSCILKSIHSPTAKVTFRNWFYIGKSW